MFSARIPLGSLTDFCRALRHMMESGLTLAQAMKQQGKRGPIAVRPVAARMADRLERGGDFRSTLADEARHFPPLFLALSSVAEDTGKLPEVLGELEDYFSLQQKLRRDFIGMIIWPVFQFVVAVLVLTALIYILGVIAETFGESPISVFGLKGGTDALLFLGGIVGFFVFLWAGYWFLGHVLKSKPAVDHLLLSIPVLGRCLRALALSRFSLGLCLTMEAGTPIAEALRLSLAATNNAAFASRSAVVAERIERGDDLVAALDGHGLFPGDFLTILETAEISGQVPEVMRRQAKMYQEEAARKLKLLTAVAAGLVWLLVAIFIIAFIFKIMGMYIGIINENLPK